MEAYALTDTGRVRSMNQDYIYASQETIGSLPNLFLVADGMGGHQAGDFASRYAVEHLVVYLNRCQKGAAVAQLQEGIRQVNAGLYDESLKREVNRDLYECTSRDPKLNGAGSTLVLATIKGSVLYVANIGDSRLYRIHGGRIRQVTKDHSYVEEMVARGKMVRGSADYNRRKNIITRAVGVSEKVKIDIFERQLRAGEYIILCSDGLTNMVEDSVILQILHGAGSLSDKAERLIELANKNGGKDKITVIIIEPNSDEVAEC